MKAWIKIISLCSISIFLNGCAMLTMKPETVTDNNPKSKINRTAAASTNIKLGMEYLKNKDIERAKLKFQQALKDAPKLAASWYSMAYFNEAAGDIKLANRNYRRAIELSPYDGEAHNNYGTFLCRHKAYKRSIKEFITAAKQPSYLTTAAAYENAGLCSMQAHQYLAATNFFKKAIGSDPRRSTSYFELAQLSFNNNQKVKAYKYYANYARLTGKPISNFQKDMLAFSKTNTAPATHKPAAKPKKKLIWTHISRPSGITRLSKVSATALAEPAATRTALILPLPKATQLQPKKRIQKKTILAIALPIILPQPTKTRA